MKLNPVQSNDEEHQLELNIEAAKCRQRRKPGRPERARWWFARMREIVRATPSWEQTAPPRPW